MSSKWNDSRPMSPHLQIWRWHGAMLSSIVHRGSAILSYIALFFVGIGLVTLAVCGSLPLENVIFSPLGAVGLGIFLFAFIFLALAQLRHAIWDKGAMFNPSFNNKLSVLMLILAAVLAVGVTLLIAGQANLGGAS